MKASTTSANLYYQQNNDFKIHDNSFFEKANFKNNISKSLLFHNHLNGSCPQINNSVFSYVQNKNVPNGNVMIEKQPNIYSNINFGTQISFPSKDNLNVTGTCNPANINNMKKTKKVRIAFTKEEDEKIKKLVNMFGPNQWNLIASYINGRTSKQCRDRYRNYLFPGNFTGEWTKEEDELLIKLFEQNGSKWSTIQKSFPERSPNSIKNRWNFFLCRQKKRDLEIENNNKRMSECSKNDDDEMHDFSFMSQMDDFSFVGPGDDLLESSMV